MEEEQISAVVKRKYQEEFEKRKIPPKLLGEIVTEYRNILNDPDCFNSSNWEGLEQTYRQLSAIINTNFKKKRTTIDDALLAGFVMGTRTALKLRKQERKKLRGYNMGYL